MPFKAAKCPNCAGDIQVPDERDTAKCMYCGSDIIVREAIKLAVPEVNLENIFRLADEAMNAGNHAEAYNYYTKILETDPENYTAWYGKAISAGWQSTLANIRLPETISGIENALKYASPEMNAELRAKAAFSLFELEVAIYKLAVDRFKNYKTTETLQEFILTTELLTLTLEQAAFYEPDNRHILESIIEMNKALLGKHTDSITGLSLSISKSIQEKAINRIQEANKRLQQIDPKYKAEIPSQKGACFIATAAYGSDMEPAVITLRQFRDYYLTTDILGNAFIKTYYHLSPPLAKLISKNEGLKALTRFLLKPLIYLIKRLQ